VKDLTQDSIFRHVLTMAVPAVVTMLVQAGHQIVMLYFVSRIGSDAVASVSAAGNVGFIVGACAQILNVGTLALVAHSAGRADLRDINFLLNQAFGLSLGCAFATVCIICAAAPLYMGTISRDEAVVGMGVRFLWWVSPAFALLFPMTAISATLRGLGVVSAPMFIYASTVVLDAAFSAILIPGRGWIPALGVEGAALASTLSLVVGMTLMLAYLRRAEPRIAIRGKQWVPRGVTWRRIFALGLPAAAELTLVFLSTSVIYFTLRNQGASAQAGFGIGFRIFQLLILPGLAVALAASSIAGQSFGAQKFSRVREVFRITALISVVVMFITAVIVQWQPEALLLLFETDSTSAATAKSFLQTISWALVAQGLCRASRQLGQND
jgi:putative MATE family efflux protein